MPPPQPLPSRLPWGPCIPTACAGEGPPSPDMLDLDGVRGHSFHCHPEWSELASGKRFYGWLSRGLSSIGWESTRLGSYWVPCVTIDQATLASLRATALRAAVLASPLACSRASRAATVASWVEVAAAMAAR